VLLSSAAVYGNPRSLPVREDESPSPISPYGFHKWQCEQLCLEFARVYGLAAAGARVFSAYGAGLRRQVLWDICERFLTRKSLKMRGTGRESRDFVHVLDITEALTTIAEHAPMEGEVYNVGSGRQVTIRDLAAMVLGAMGSDGTPEFDGTTAQGVPINWQADNSKIKGLGFTPKISLEDGVRGFVNWCRGELSGV
jgi:UDP-glucose 4-epimerase